MVTKIIIRLAACALLLIALSGNGYTQIVYNTPPTVSIKTVYNNWHLDRGDQKSTLSQVTIPMTLFMPLQDNSEMVVFVSGSANDLQMNDGDYNMTGAGDLRLQFNHSMSNDRAVIGLGINLPTGKHKLDFDADTMLINTLSQTYLTLPMRRFGEGLGLNFLLGGATMMGKLRVGAGISYEYVGSYTAYESQEEFDPGDRTTITVGFERAGKTLVKADLLMTFYTDDKYDHHAVFRTGDQAALSLYASRRFNSGQLGFNIRYLARTPSAMYSFDAGDLIQQLDYQGNELSIGSSFGYAFSKKWSVTPLVGYRWIAADGLTGPKHLEQSKIGHIGANLDHKIGKKLRLSLESRYYSGNADDGAIDLSGLQISTGLTASF
ncbi:MAG: hypothetical protein V3T31_01340 [candidate division Zixibacteria bacterium]